MFSILDEDPQRTVTTEGSWRLLSPKLGFQMH